MVALVMREESFIDFRPPLPTTVVIDISFGSRFSLAHKSCKKPSHPLIIKRANMRGRPETATVVTPTRDSETASEVGLGRLVEVYVPLRFAMAERPAGLSRSTLAMPRSLPRSAAMSA